MEFLRLPYKQQHVHGIAMIFCNPDPISASCYLSKNTVKSAIDAFTSAIIDLTTQNNNLNVDLGFIKLNINKKNLSYKYK